MHAEATEGMNQEGYGGLAGRGIAGGGRTEAQEPQAGNGCITRERFLDPVQTNEILGRVSTGFLVQMREESGRASGLSD